MLSFILTASDNLNTVANGDWTGITQLISTLGFPIVCCIVLFYQNNKLQDTLKNFENVLTQINASLTTINQDMRDLRNNGMGGAK